MDPSAFIKHFKAAAAHLAEHREDINRLNVFPVPDGDTGTNMSLTINSVVKELDALPPTATPADVSKALTHGSLMGARGNSGVITSQILRGCCEALEPDSVLDTQTVAVALQNAVKVAFGAVRRPVEGTILTVLKDMSAAADQAAADSLDVSDALQQISAAGLTSVEHTPELLPVLKENGVVDAGGYGLALLVEALVASMLGRSLLPVSGSVESEIAEIAPKVAIEQIDDWEGSSYLYCTEFLFNGENLDEDATREFLSSMGDCELLVGSSPDYKIHVHTNEPGKVLNYMTDRGQVSEVFIHNMRMQSEERNAMLEGEEHNFTEPVTTATPATAAANTDSQTAAVETPAITKKRGYIAVSSGSGIEKILRSLGVDVIVNGGQTMNPSTAELLTAIDSVPAEEVVVFPNNSNIIMAAQAAADNSSKSVVVIPTKNVPECFSALFVADTDLSLEEESEAMRDALGEVRSAEVTHAIKDSKSANGEPIHIGDVIGITGGNISCVGNDVNTVALDLIAQITDNDSDTLTLLAGEDMSDTDFEQLQEQVEERFPELEMDAHRGEQPLYPLVMAAE